MKDDRIYLLHVREGQKMGTFYISNRLVSAWARAV